MNVGEQHLIKLALTVWPFPEDAPPLEIGVVDGIVWATAKGIVGVCGYALIPAEGHPWSKQWPIGRDQSDDRKSWKKTSARIYELTESGVDMGQAMAIIAEEGFGQDHDHGYMDDFLDVHGGVSWYEHPWVGFDTGHSGDLWPPEWDERDLCAIEREYPSDWQRVWTPELVAEEARNLARQVAEVASLERSLEVDAGAAEGD